MTKHPREMSEDELRALPIGPFRKENGKVVRPGTLIHRYESDDPLAYRVDGRLYAVGQWRDGTWFREHSVWGLLP